MHENDITRQGWRQQSRDVRLLHGPTPGTTVRWLALLPEVMRKHDQGTRLCARSYQNHRIHTGKRIKSNGSGIHQFEATESVLDGFDAVVMDCFYKQLKVGKDMIFH